MAYQHLHDRLYQEILKHIWCKNVEAILLSDILAHAIDQTATRRSGSREISAIRTPSLIHGAARIVWIEYHALRSCSRSSER